MYVCMYVLVLVYWGLTPQQQPGSYQADDYFIPTAKLKTTINSPIIQASKLYNNYKNQLDFHTSVGTQKRMVKRMILGSYTENLDR